MTVDVFLKFGSGNSGRLVSESNSALEIYNKDSFTCISRIHNLSPHHPKKKPRLTDAPNAYTRETLTSQHLGSVSTVIKGILSQWWKCRYISSHNNGSVETGCISNISFLSFWVMFDCSTETWLCLRKVDRPKQLIPRIEVSLHSPAPRSH